MAKEKFKLRNKLTEIIGRIETSVNQINSADVLVLRDIEKVLGETDFPERKLECVLLEDYCAICDEKDCPRSTIA